jgi:hypothetical protein
MKFVRFTLRQLLAISIRSITIPKFGLNYQSSIISPNRQSKQNLALYYLHNQIVQPGHDNSNPGMKTQYLARGEGLALEAADELENHLWLDLEGDFSVGLEVGLGGLEHRVREVGHGR